MVVLGSSRGVQAQQGLQALPELARVIDTTQTLAPSDTSALDAQLAAIEKTRGSQIAVVLIATTAPEDIAQYSNRLAQHFKLGRRAVGDGLLLVIAKDDKRMRIEVARRLEGAVPDVLAGRILRQTLQPAFRQGQFAQGISAAIAQLDGLLAGEGLPDPGSAGAVAKLPTTIMTWVLLSLILLPLLTLFFTNLWGRLASVPLNGLVVGATGFFASNGLGWSIGWACVVMALTAAGHLVAASWAKMLPLQGGMRSSRAQRGGFPFPIETGGRGGFGNGGLGGGGGFRSGGGGSFGGGGASGSW